MKDSEPTARRRKKYWWLYGRDAKNLYHAIGRGDSFESHPKNWKENLVERPDYVIACARVSKFFCPSFIKNDAIFSEQVVVFGNADWGSFALYNSSIFQIWVHNQSSTMGSGLRVTPSDCIETFPFPNCQSEALQRLGQELHKLRQQAHVKSGMGLTDLNNAFHDPSSGESFLIQLRDIQQQIDEAVADSFAWSDIKISLDFVETSYLPENDCVRFTVSEETRRDLLYRLWSLNRDECLKEEQKKGGRSQLRASPKQLRISREVKKNQISDSDHSYRENPSTDQMSLFSSDGSSTIAQSGNQWGETAFDQIEAWLEDQGEWRAKPMIIRGCGCSPDEFDSAVENLVKEGWVESKETHNGTLYRATH